MNIWIANPFDEPPAPGVPRGRYRSLCDAFAAAGHRVTWWSCDWSHLWKRRREPSAADPVRGWTVRLLQVRPYWRNVGFRRWLSHRDYALALRKEGEKAVNQGELPPPDWVIASLPPLGVLERLAPWKIRWGTRLGLDLMDAWPEAFRTLLPSPLFTPLLAPLRWQADRAYRLADRISAVGRRYGDIAAARAPRTPLHLCYHGTDWDRFAPRTPKPKGPDEVITLVHLGALNRGYDLYTPVRALAATGGERLVLQVAGRGEQESDLRDLARHLGVADRVHFHGQVGAEKVPHLLAEADVGLVTNRSSTLVACPYKAAEYAAAGLPILSGLKGEFAELLERFQLGVTYTEGDCLDFLDGLARLRALPLPDPQRIRALFDRAVTYPRLVRFYEEGS